MRKPTIAALALTLAALIGGALASTAPARAEDLDADGIPDDLWLELPAMPSPAGAPAALDLLGATLTATTWQLDSGTGAGVVIGPTGFTLIQALARDASGTFWAATGDSLITVDPTTGIGTLVAVLDFGGAAHSVRGMAFVGSTLYVARSDADVSAIDELYTVDIATGVATLVGSLGYSGVQGLETAPDGVLYGWDILDGLLTVDPATGVATDVNASVGGTGFVQGIAFHPDGSLFGARDEVYTIDRVTGTFSVVGSGGYSDLRGIVSLARRPVAGSVTGMTPANVVCWNQTTGQRIVVAMTTKSWDCEALGLIVNAGDTVLIGARGSVD